MSSSEHASILERGMESAEHCSSEMKVAEIEVDLQTLWRWNLFISWYHSNCSFCGVLIVKTRDSDGFNSKYWILLKDRDVLVSTIKWPTLLYYSAFPPPDLLPLLQPVCHLHNACHWQEGMSSWQWLVVFCWDLSSDISVTQYGWELPPLVWVCL